MEFSDKEIAQIQDVEFFRSKAVITQKMKTLLLDLREGLRPEVSGTDWLAPEGTDFSDGQLVKGEHLQNFPYQYLDLPKYFTNNGVFTFRTLLWWGHHGVFALFLGGERLEVYKRRLLDAYEELADRSLYLLMTTTPWEWRKAPEIVLELRRDNKSEVAEALAVGTFLKLHRYLSFDDPAFAKGALTREGVATFRHFRPIIAAKP